MQRYPRLRYEPDENPPAGTALGCGVQLVVLGLANIVLIPTIVIRAAGGTDAYLSWAVFRAVAVSGVSTALQDRMGLLADRPDDVLMEREVSLRLLRHIASSVRHQQFHDSDIVTVRVEVPETHRGR